MHFSFNLRRSHASAACGVCGRSNRSSSCTVQLLEKGRLVRTYEHNLVAADPEVWTGGNRLVFCSVWESGESGESFSNHFSNDFSMQPHIFMCGDVLFFSRGGLESDSPDSP